MFNTPYCHKPERFAQAYVTKIVNQVGQIAKAIAAAEEWTFEVADFRQTLSKTTPEDFVYADPPYAGRSVDYFNSWSDIDEAALEVQLGSLPCDFMLSTWHSNTFRKNAAIDTAWAGMDFRVSTREHFYHVGASEELRHPMTEAFITNFDVVPSDQIFGPYEQDLLFS